MKNVSGHAGYRMKQRKISIDDLVKDLKEPSATDRCSMTESIADMKYSELIK